MEPKVTAIIQARMTSTRLPGKVLMEVMGRPLLSYQIERLRFSKRIDEIIIATTMNKEDDPIAKLSRKEGLKVFRGSEDDVLDRYYQAAKEVNAKTIVRITGDCPLIDPMVVEKVISHYLVSKCDYASNIAPPTFPDGLDTEVFSFDALEKAWEKAKWQSEREHVTPYIRNRPEIFHLENLENGEDLSNMRWTVDEAADLEFVRAVYSKLETMSSGMSEVIAVLEKYPELRTLNDAIVRNEGYMKSLREDKLVKNID